MDEEVDNLITKAKHKVVNYYGGNPREWLECSPRNSYGRDTYRVTLYVLSGSPPKGYVLVDHCYGIVRGFGVRMCNICTFKAKNRLCL